MARSFACVALHVVASRTPSQVRGLHGQYRQPVTTSAGGLQTNAESAKLEDADLDSNAGTDVKRA